MYAQYVAARDLVSARREFGSTTGKTGRPDVRFNANVPAPMREAFMKELDAERAERRDWAGNGKVGVLVAVDSPVTISGVRMSRTSAASGGRTMSRMIAPSALTGDRCVVQILLPSADAWSKVLDGSPQGPARPLLDACGFYDAFGPPGAAIAHELVDNHFSSARGYEIADHDDPLGRARSWSNLRYDMSAARCLSGDDGSCWTAHSKMAWWERERTPSGWPGGSEEWPLPTSRYHLGGLNRLALDLGPERFARVWKSSKTLEDAYFDETGETWATYVRRKYLEVYDAYTPGPWTTPISLVLTLLTVAALVAATLKFGRRPRVA